MLLVIGCLLVASPAFNRPTECDEVAVAVASTRSGRVQKTSVVDSRADMTLTEEDVVDMWDSVMGVGAVLLMVTISGFASIYFEGILKKSGDRVLTIWERNFQLAFYSAIVLIVYLVLEENAQGTLVSYVLFQGWTVNTVLITLIQAGGGLLVAATLKYADAVLKTLATSGSIVLSAVLGCLLLGGTLDIFVGIGCLATILAIFNYTLDTTPTPPPAIATAVPSRQDV